MSAYLSAQTNWHIDEGNVTGLASNRNSGADATHPLLTDGERVRRMGRNFDWSAARYDIWCLSDVALMELYGTRRNGSQIWVHGSGTAYQGRTILSSGNTMSQCAVAVPSAQTRPSIRGGAAGSFLTTIANPNRRLRLTSGARSGATSFAQSIQGSDVNVSQWMQLSTFDPTAFNIPHIVDPAGTETYVVESLGSISNCYSALTTTDGTSTNPLGVIFDSVNFGRFGSTLGECYPIFIGCAGVSPLSLPDENFAIHGTFIVFGSFTIAGRISTASFASLYAAHNVGTWVLGRDSTLSLYYNTITEGTSMVQMTDGGGTAYVFGAASFNSNNDGLVVSQGSNVIVNPVFTQAGSPTVVGEPALWGSGNTGAGANVQPGGRLSYKAGLLPNITGARDRLVGDIKGSWSDGPVRDKGADAQVFAT